MKDIKGLAVTGVVALVVSLVVTFSFGGNGGTTTVERVVEKLGAVVGPDTTFDFWGVGGVRQWSSSSSLRTASTTICSLKSPSNATTSLAYASIRIGTGTTTAMILEVSKGLEGQAGATGSSTTRFISNFTWAANQVGTLFASTSNATLLTGQGTLNSTFTPNTNLNFILNNGSGAGQLAPTGKCEAVWVE